jgi:hypothetical protein
MNKQQEELIAAMVFSIEEILEKSQREANGVSFEEALKRTSEYSSTSGDIS